MAPSRSGLPPNSMSPADRSLYFLVLYLTLALVAAANAILVIGGNRAAAYSLLVQVVVFLCAFPRKPWSFWVVALWSAVCIVGAAAMWLAIVLRGSFSLPIWVVTYKTVLLLVCLYFISEGRSAFASRPIDGVGSPGA
jgi:hypothetical protein